MRILDVEFNQVVGEMCARVWPDGFDTSEEQTQNFEEMNDHYRVTGRLTVNTLYSEQTIFGLPEVNWQFRAWHDYCHLLGNFPFDAQGEKCASSMQIRQLWTYYPNHPKLTLFERLIDIEVNGQVDYFIEHGDFPVDQFEFTLGELKKRGFHV